jgi:hypothetical protein
MTERHTEPSTDAPFHARRRLLKLLSIAAYSALAAGLAGCAEESTKSWERPDWFRSKRGTNGHGRGR